MYVGDHYYDEDAHDGDDDDDDDDSELTSVKTTHTYIVCVSYTLMSTMFGCAWL